VCQWCGWCARECGGYYFLKQNPIGSAAPGKRALSVNYNQINHHEYVDGVLKNDFITVEIYPENRQMFHEIFPNQTIHYPAEFGYGLVANKWFFKTFKGKIGLIGGHERLSSSFPARSNLWPGERLHLRDPLASGRPSPNRASEGSAGCAYPRNHHHTKLGIGTWSKRDLFSDADICFRGGAIRRAYRLPRTLFVDFAG
jgi:hypothetical protein